MGVAVAVLGGLGLRRVALDDEHRDRDRGSHQAGADQVGEVIAGVERAVDRLAGRLQAVAALGRDRRQDREADRAADLRRRVDEAGRHARVLLRRAGHRQRHQRREWRACHHHHRPASRRARTTARCPIRRRFDERRRVVVVRVTRTERHERKLTLNLVTQTTEDRALRRPLDVER